MSKYILETYIIGQEPAVQFKVTSQNVFDFAVPRKPVEEIVDLNNVIYFLPIFDYCNVSVVRYLLDFDMAFFVNFNFG